MDRLTGFDEARVRALRERGEFFWLDLPDPPPEELERLGELLGIPPLAVEDSIEFGQRPKIDDFGERLLIVFFGAHAGVLEEVHLHLSGREVVTVRRGGVPSLERVDCAAARTEEDLVYRLLDALTDAIVVLVAGLLADAEALEDAAYEHPTDRERQRISELRGDLFGLGQRVRGLRDVMSRAADRIEAVPGLEREEARHPFNDVLDDLVQTGDRIEYARELLSQALDVHLAQQGNQLNEIATRLTLIATVFLPLTFVTGFFGQNFDWLVTNIESAWAFWGLGVGGCVLAVGLPAFVFWRAGLLGRRGP